MARGKGGGAAGGGGSRVQRVAAEIKEILGELVARGGIKDPRVSDAGLITFTHVKVTGDLQNATALFMVYGADDKKLAEVRKGLQSASGYLRRLLGEKLRLRVPPSIDFEVDRVFAQEERVDSILRDLAPKPAPAASEGDGGAEDEPE